MYDIALSVRVLSVGKDWSFDGDGESFVPQCVTCTIYCVRTNEKLLCARYSIVDIVLACAVVEIVLDPISEVAHDSHESVFCINLRLDVSC